MRYQILFVCSFLCSGLLFAEEVTVVDNFNTKTVLTNSMRKETGAWSTEPKESGKGCVFSFGPDADNKPEGASLRIAYDVRSQSREKQPMCGYWTRLTLNLSKMKYLKMKIKGEPSYGYPGSLILELKDKDFKTGKYTIEGITGQWQEFVIPLGAFKDLQDWSNVIELGLLFHESIGRDNGALLIDDIAFYGDASGGSSGGPFSSAFSKKKLALDGSGWNKRQLTMVALDGKANLEYGDIKGRNDLSAEIYSQWDNEYLYFLAEIRDDELVVVEEADQIQEGDGLTFLFDTLGDGFLSDGEDDKADLLLPNGKARILSEDREPAGDEVRFTVTPSRGKYTIVAAFSWKYLGTKPERNKDIVLSFAVQDLDITPATKKGRVNWVYNPGSGSIELGKMKLK